MISYSPMAIEPHYRPAIVMFLLVGAICFTAGYFLGDSDGREERAMLRRTFAVMSAVEAQKPKRQPCLPVFLSRRDSAKEADEKIERIKPNKQK